MSIVAASNNFFRDEVLNLSGHNGQSLKIDLTGTRGDGGATGGGRWIAWLTRDNPADPANPLIVTQSVVAGSSVSFTLISGHTIDTSHRYILGVFADAGPTSATPASCSWDSTTITIT